MNTNVKDLLPIGTVVLLKEAQKRVMIFGVKQTVEQEGGKREYDYIGVPYPEGNLGADFQYLFDHDNIGEVFFRGFEDIERQEFIFNLSKYYKNK